MIPKKPAPDLIRGGNRFSEKIMLKQKNRPAIARIVRRHTTGAIGNSAPSKRSSIDVRSAVRSESEELGDPNYLRKANALYYEFEEIGLNKRLGYESPSDLVDRYPNYIGTTSLHTSGTLSVSSMSLRAGVGGLRFSTATHFGPSVIFAFRGRSPKAPQSDAISSRPSVRAAALGL